MKRLICTILATVFVVIFMSAANSNATNVNAANQTVYGNFHHYQNFDEIEFFHALRARPLPATLDELIERVPNVVRGRLANDAEIVFQFNRESQPDHPTTGHNRVSLEILEVIQGDLTVGETISILEPYFIQDRVLFSWANYSPSIPYQEYFFFLGDRLADIASELVPPGYEGAFFVLQGYRGRFRVPNIQRFHVQEFSFDELSLGEYTDSYAYTHLWNEVIDAFITNCANLQASENQYNIPTHHHGNFKQVTYMTASRVFTPSNLAELEDRVPNIVRGRIGNDSEIVYQYNGGFTFPTHNKVSLEILEVIRGDLLVAETISILEPYFIENNTLYTWANYMPSIPYYEYFFFLGYSAWRNWAWRTDET